MPSLICFGDQITPKSYRKPESHLIIFAGIVSGIPSAISNTIAQVMLGSMDFAVVIGIFLIMVATILAIIYVELGERRIPISYSRKTLLQNKTKRIMNYIPIRVNISGVIPPIFASADFDVPFNNFKSEYKSNCNGYC